MATADFDCALPRHNYRQMRCRRGDWPRYLAVERDGTKLFHDWQFWVNGTGVAKVVGSGLFCGGWICVSLWGFMPRCSERVFSYIWL